jgi:sulfur relay (sulfurtransferase) complex TusBCD TusD component (DsrE family)
MMKLGIIIYSNDREVLHNAFSLASFALDKGDKVSVFLSGKGVESGLLSKTEAYAADTFNTTEQINKFVTRGGQVLASRECLSFRGLGVPDLCVAGTMNDLYSIVKDSDRVVAF